MTSVTTHQKAPRESGVSAWFRFYEELNDFLPEARRKLTFRHHVNRRASVKDVIESLGVPHTEVELILVNGESVGFTYIVRDGDRISVYPVFESLDIRPLLRLRPSPLRTPRFVLDTHLGKLARYLRLMGFDSHYRNDFTDDELAGISNREKRILLTRDRLLLQRSVVTHGCFVRSDDPKQQVIEVLRRFDLADDIAPLTRCIRCNGKLSFVDKSDVYHRLEPKTQRYYEDFRICDHCRQVYWKGSHFRKMNHLIDEFRHALAPRPS
jgi:uncharacterized protein with PIN domain/sulfur carrier protein ThiS